MTKPITVENVLTVHDTNPKNPPKPVRQSQMEADNGSDNLSRGTSIAMSRMLL